MKNFLQFIRRFFNLLLFIALEVICLVLIARTNTLQGNDVLNSSNQISGFFYAKQNDLAKYFELRKVNDSLLAENAQLYKLLADKKYSFDTLHDSVTVHTFPATDSLHPVRYAKYTYRTAKVINNSVDKENNYFTLNRGSDDGIHRGMAVISGRGVAGRIAHTSAHFSTAVSVLSSIVPVSAKLKDGTTGLVTWSYEQRQRKPDVLYLPKIPQQVPLHIGDTVWTSSDASLFLPDVIVGFITRSDIVKKTGERLLTLRPATSFRNMQYVYVVENAMAGEQTQLEKQLEVQPKKKEGKR